MARVICSCSPAVMTSRNVRGKRAWPTAMSARLCSAMNGKKMRSMRSRSISSSKRSISSRRRSSTSTSRPPLHQVEKIS